MQHNETEFPASYANDDQLDRNYFLCSNQINNSFRMINLFGIVNKISPVTHSNAAQYSFVYEMLLVKNTGRRNEYEEFLWKMCGKCHESAGWLMVFNHLFHLGRQCHFTHFIHNR